MSEIEIISLNNTKSHFSSHFHEFYVVGFIKKGRRIMLCNGVEYSLNSGDAVIFNPYDVHSCKNSHDDFMEYYALNMDKCFVKECFQNKLPNFQNVIKVSSLPPVFFFSPDKKHCARVLKNLPHSFENPYKNHTPEIGQICKAIEQNISNKISLEFLCNLAGLSKSSLLRAFVKQKGITPYKYIENVRINRAKTLLQKGVSPLDTALEVGFSSQSHFSNTFKSLIGLTPFKYQKRINYGR